MTTTSNKIKTYQCWFDSESFSFPYKKDLNFEKLDPPLGNNSQKYVPGPYESDFFFKITSVVYTSSLDTDDLALSAQIISQYILC